MEFSKLTQKEKRHLREIAFCNTLEQFQRTASIQASWRRKNPQHEPCFQCKFIARKLGLPV